MDLPSHPVLAEVARNLEEHGWAAWITDPELNLLWISSEFEEIVGLGLRRQLGQHFLAATLGEEVRSITTERSLLRCGLDLLPMYLRFTPGGRPVVKEMLESHLGPGAGDVVDGVPDEVGPITSTSLKVKTIEGMEPARVSCLVVQLRDDQGALVGHISMFVGTLPFRFIALLARGDEATLARTARLATQGQRQAAILFADLESSGVLSSRLPSALYFRLVQDVIGSLDHVVTSHTGLVGRHAGDGVTAFFIADDVGSPSLAARAAVEAARTIMSAVGEVAVRYETETEGLVTPKDLLVNIGVHWGNSLYMGQLVSKGRLEVTALGDPVNECARIQESASEGRMLVSKQLLENLTDEDAQAAGIRPAAISYQRLSEMPGATGKAIRDAGGIAVAEL